MRKTLVAMACLAAPRAAVACPVCFGQSDSPMAWGANAGIFFMLGVTGVVLASFAGFFVYLMRRAQLVAGAGATAEAAGHPGRTRREPAVALPGVSGPRKGTAPC